MKNIFLTLAALVLLGSGCVTNRSVNVIVRRVEIGAATNGITSAEGLEWFTGLANERNLVVSRPHILADDLTEYAAGPSTQPSLILWLYPKKLEFEVCFFGTAKDFPNAREIAKSITDKLDQRHIPYNVRTWVAIPPP
jgi:hypothetical protein